MTGEKILAFSLIILNFVSVYGLYADQAGKFDWRQQYVGHIDHLFWDQSVTLGKRILVATDQHLVAAIHSHNGSIAWRKIQEDDNRGVIDAIDHQNNALVTVNGGGRFVRSWQPSSGSLYWEVELFKSSDSSTRGDIRIYSKDEVLALSPTAVHKLNLHNGKEKWALQLPAKDNVVFGRLVLHGSNLYVVGRSAGAHVMVISSDSEGTLKQQRSVPAAWIKEETDCETLDEGVLLCYDDVSSNLQLLNLESGQLFVEVQLQELGLSAEGKAMSLEKLRLHTSDHAKSHLLLRIGGNHMAILKVSKDRVQVVKDLPKVSAAYVTKVEDLDILLTLQRVSKQSVLLVGYDLASGGEITELSQSITLPASHGLPTKLDAVVVKKNGRLAYKALVRSEDQSLQLVQKSGRVSWKREEALASVLSVEMVDFPVSENQAKYEDEFGAQKEDVVSMFVKRFATQFQQLKNLVIHQLQKLQGHRHHSVLEADALEEDEEEEELTRDEFNINKMIVVVTGAGKIFGLRSTNGHVQWSVYLPELVAFRTNDKDNIMLFVQRTTAHFPNPPQCVIIGKNKLTGQGLLYAFNPISGQPVGDVPYGGLSLGYNVKQAYMIGEVDDHFLRGIIFLDDNHQIHTYPETFMSVAMDVLPSLFMYVADTQTGFLKGFKAKLHDKDIIADNVWTINLQKKQQIITNVVGKRVLEQVHSQGRVLGDRSVLYKYMNPNLVVVTTEGEEASSLTKGSNNFVNIYLIDSITGHIVFHASHRKTKGPVNVVHVENWVVYDYFNQKARRHEIAVIELFEGKEQGNSSAFSSFTAPREPLVLRQSYIMPVHITTMDVTVTEKGITSRSLLFAMTAGKILSLPKALLDPRRPVIPSQETMEEGTIPYIPEIPISTEMMVNYYNSVDKIKGIHSSPAGLESTSLVFVYGLDLFYTRVTPSRMFDVLKEDFDFYFISLVLLGMFLVTFFTQKLASRKALSRAWK
ncbi:ER membrane protein complex subunit 1-like [Mizuhopecten yessoensis]|uniref:ER membrane protein complex subunit 1 n=1 Tax=Mizuhopecten yessoensis TaxID=6573 RepID=A0A210Q2X9_MIZYE|nr:ER membrane protein complex subunit 1-like [Mizuhopecten yessoensis]OWF43072.1 ER membrane protein complex subunit 1 [Mizuhopecten yessoensis]